MPNDFSKDFGVLTFVQQWKERRYRAQEVHALAALEKNHTILHELYELTQELRDLHQKIDCLREQHWRYMESRRRFTISIRNNGSLGRCVHCKPPVRQNELPSVGHNELPPGREESVEKESYTATQPFPVSFSRNERAGATAREGI